MGRGSGRGRGKGRRGKALSSRKHTSVVRIEHETKHETKHERMLNKLCMITI